MQLVELLGDDFGAPLFTSTGDVRALVDSLQSNTDMLNLDITQTWFPTVSAQPAANEFVNAWIRWRDQTYAWIKEFRGYWTYLAWNQYDIAAAKLNDLVTWRHNYEQVSGRKATGPSPNIPEGAKPVDLEGIIKTVAIVGAVGVVVWVGFKAYLMHKATRALSPVSVVAPKLTTAGWGRRRYARRR